MSRKLAIILLIEDNPGDARLVREMLSEGTGVVYSLEWVENLEAGLRRIAQGGIDLVLLDLGLPESAGLETLRRLCAASSQLPAVVVMSGLGDDAIAEQAVLEGAQDYLVKGQVDARLLRRSIRYAIERNEATVALRRAHDELENQIRERTTALAGANEALQRENTERKQAEEGLRNKEQQIQSLFDKSERSRRSLLSLLEDQKRAEETLLRLNRELQARSKCNQVLVRAEDEQALLNDICRIVCDEAGYRMAWVGYAQYDDARTIRPVAWAGVEDGYLELANITWADTEQGHGPSGTAIRSGKSACIQDFATNGRAVPWRENALQRGYRSSIALPMKDENAKPFGVLNIYSSQPNAFTADEIQLLEEMSGDLAFGIMVLRARIERKRAEEQLRESERRYRIAQAMGHVGNWEYNLQTSHFWGSDEAKRIYGFDPEQADFSTDEVENCIPDWQRTHQALMDLIELGKPYNLEFEIVPRNSSQPRIIASIAELQRDQHGEPLKVIGVIQDITERKRAEDALYEAQQVFRTLVENSPDIIARYDRNCRRTYVNPTYLKMTHISQQELLATAPIQRSPLPADSAVVLQNLLSRVLDSGVAEAVDVIWSKTDAGEFWYNIYAFPEFDREGRVVSVMTISRDITERKQTEEELKRMNERFSLAAGAARLGVWDWNIQKNELVWDDGMYALYGIQRGDFAGAYEAWLAGVHPDDRVSSDEISKLARRGEREYDTEFRVVWPDGSIHYLKAYGKMIRDMDGSPLRMTGINFDITERKQLEQDRLAHLQFVESMDRINRAIQGTNNLEQMMRDVLDVVISIFDCDRAFLMYPCDPDAVTWGVPMERSKPEYPGVLAQKLEIPMDLDVARTLRELLAADRPLKFGPETDHPLPDDIAQQFGFRSFMSMAICPKVGKPWQFGIHQCSYPRVWTPFEEKLLEEIGRRLEDALTGLLSHRQLQESEQRFRLVFENSPVSIWEEDFSGVKMLFDDLRKAGATDIAVYFAQHPEMIRQCAEKTKIVDINQAALALHGAASKDELLKDLAKTFTQESFDTFRQELVCLWNGESEMIKDAVVKTLAGEPRHVTVYFTVCPGHEQTFSKVLVSLVDITERKRAEEALVFVAQRGWESTEENFFDALAKFLGEKLEMDYVFIDRIDEDPHMAETVALYAKGTIRPNIRYTLKGTPCENVMGRQFCIYPRGIQQLFPEDTLLPGMGAESYIGIPLWDSTGRPIGLIAIIGSKPLSDDAPVTQLLQLVAIRAAAELERKRVEENIRRLNQDLERRVVERTAQLESVNKELEAFSYSVSHDLRAPLRGIDGFSQVLLDEYQDKVDQQGKNYLQRVRFAAQHMAQLIDDMLSLSRVNRGDMANGQVDLSGAAREIAEDLRQSQPDRQVEFVIPDGIHAQGDGRLLRVVLENLIRNAWKFTSRHSTARIEFGIQQQQEIQVYFVRDDGAGFDMKYAQKLFGAFQRLHTINEFPGTGVGLATVQRIIHRHGGKVWAEGNVEKGATFYFSLP